MGVGPSRRREEFKRWVLCNRITLAALLFIGFASVTAFVVTTKEVKVIADGKTVVIRTHAGSVNKVLKQAGISLFKKDAITPGLEDKIKDGDLIKITRAFPVYVEADGKVTKIMTVNAVVKDVLAEARVEIRAKDKVDPGLDGRVSSKSHIRIVRVDQSVITEMVNLPYKIEAKKDKHIDKGMSKVLRVGKSGLKERSILVTYEDGKEVSRQVVAEKVLSQPVTQIVAVGTRKPLRTLMVSRGNVIRYRDSYVMHATAYEPGPRSCGAYADGYTAIGTKAQKGVVAVDPRIIPLRSRLYIDGYGFAVAADTGSAIKGNRIDLCFDTVREALSFGRRNVRVYVLEK